MLLQMEPQGILRSILLVLRLGVQSDLGSIFSSHCCYQLVQEMTLCIPAATVPGRLDQEPCIRFSRQRVMMPNLKADMLAGRALDGQGGQQPQSPGPTGYTSLFYPHVHSNTRRLLNIYVWSTSTILT